MLPMGLVFILLLTLCHQVVNAQSTTGLKCVIAEINQFSGEYSFSSSDPAFQNVTDVDNGRCVVDPLIILWPASIEDVAIGIKASRTCNISISVISGGHSAACFSLAEGGITLSLRDLDAIEPDLESGVMRVQAGAIFKDVYTSVFNMTEGADNSYWVPIGGGCPYVGVGGFFLGGGWSFLSRSYGMAIDMMISITTVLADGRVVKADASESCQASMECRELWWASRGGGGGNFGYATEYVFQMRRAPKEILVGQLCWPPDTPQLGEVWGWLMDSYDTFPNWIQIDSGWLPLAEDGSSYFCHTVICNNPSEKACMDIVQPAIDLGGVVYNDLAMQPYLSWQIQHDEITSAQHGQLYLTNVMMDVGTLTPDIMVTIQDALMAAPSSRNLVITHMGGGAITDVSAEETAFPHRESQFVLQIKAIWSDTGSATDAARNIAWVTDLKNWLTPLANGSYVNYMDPYLIDWEEKYYTGNLPRLQEAKKLLDPENIFHFGQSIPLPLIEKHGSF